MGDEAVAAVNNKANAKGIQGYITGDTAGEGQDDDGFLKY
jgi:hypothetical protein